MEMTIDEYKTYRDLSTFLLLALEKTKVIFLDQETREDCGSVSLKEEIHEGFSC